jgi:hypothetical protein
VLRYPASTPLIFWLNYAPYYNFDLEEGRDVHAFEKRWKSFDFSLNTPKKYDCNHAGCFIENDTAG